MNAAWPRLHGEGRADGPAAPLLDQLAQLRARLEGLPVSGWEASCRFSPLGLEPFRLGVGLAPGLLEPVELARDLGMPADGLRRLARSAAFANHVYLAVEQGGDGVYLKLYLEFAVQTRFADGRLAPAGLQMIGLKWQPGSAPSADGVRLTRYELLPQTPLPEVLAHLGGPVGDGEQVHGPAQLAAWALALADRRVDLSQGMLPWVQAREPGALARVADDFNFYGSGLRVGDLALALGALVSRWGWAPSVLPAWLDAVQQADLGHLSVGWRQAGQPFFTIYHPAPC